MKKLRYKCTLLSDVIITSNSATDGIHQSLDYIPGSKFLGLVAGSGLYEENQTQQCLDLFHNGYVRFGDAHPFIDGERLRRIPLAWHFPKGEEGSGDIFLYHNLTNSIKRKLTQNGVQLKQARNRYFSNAESLEVQQKFSIKSAYDLDSLRSKDGQMYGYFGLEKGTEWSFIIEIKEEDSGKTLLYNEMIDDTLIGVKRIGRSKSAEYGLLKISFDGELPKEEIPDFDGDETYLYAESNLCFYDKYGNSTAQPTLGEMLNSEKELDAKIVWEKSQIRTRTYRTWNRKRKSRNADRIIIEKGSVIVLSKSIEPTLFKNGIGAHHNEGFGRVLVNPDFLISDSEQLNRQIEKRKEVPKQTNLGIVTHGEDDKKVIAFLKNRNKQEQSELIFSEQINDFVETHKNQNYQEIKNSQWGQIRKYAKISKGEKVLQALLFNKDIGFCYRGQSENTWRKLGRRIELEKYLFEQKRDGISVIDFTIKLCAEMSKISKN